MGSPSNSAPDESTGAACSADGCEASGADGPTEAAPEWEVERWLNTASNPTLASLAGRVVVLEAFQMLCPSCVSHGLPQARRIHELFDAQDVVVLGLHAVFEHHAAMGVVALEAFLHEYAIRFPVGIDAPGEGPVPLTMERYALRGTPSLLLFDRRGRLRAQHFGNLSDLHIGAEIATLVSEPGPAGRPRS